MKNMNQANPANAKGNNSPPGTLTAFTSTPDNQRSIPCELLPRLRNPAGARGKAAAGGGMMGNVVAFPGHQPPTIRSFDEIGFRMFAVPPPSFPSGDRAAPV